MKARVVYSGAIDLDFTRGAQYPVTPEKQIQIRIVDTSLGRMVMESFLGLDAMGDAIWHPVTRIS